MRNYASGLNKELTIAAKYGLHFPNRHWLDMWILRFAGTSYTTVRIMHMIIKKVSIYGTAV